MYFAFAWIHKFPASYETYVKYIKVMILEATVYVYERTCKRGALLSSEIFTGNEYDRTCTGK